LEAVVSLSISVFGLGYVGSVTATCFAHTGHRVTGVDVNAVKVEMLDSGRAPIVEAGMKEMVAEANRACRLHATMDSNAAVCNSDVSFICVGTPSRRNGSLDLSHVEHAAHEIGAALKMKRTHHTVVLRSTVLPGTTESLLVPALEHASGLRCGKDFAVCYNPEFMREGSAVSDFLQPPFTVLGAKDEEHLAPLRELYASVDAEIVTATIPVAEMLKYASNAFHALKVSFANEIGTLCKMLNVDTQAMVKIFTADNKLNLSSAYLSPGFAFGGSCLPKDLRAIRYRAKELDLAVPLLDAILASNDGHLHRAVDAVLRTNHKRIAVLGLSFKAGTDDLRESPQVQLIKRLLGEGCSVRVWDEDVSLGRITGSNRQYIEDVIPHIGSLLSADFEEVVCSADVVVVGTKAVDMNHLSRLLVGSQIVIDLVNLEPSHRPRGVSSYEGMCW
jgi:GDP-mannose 6-dehydrogenase